MSLLLPRVRARTVRWLTVLSMLGALFASEPYAAAQSNPTPNDSTTTVAPAPPAKPGFVSLAPA